jgi:hypothetical protein
MKNIKHWQIIPIGLIVFMLALAIGIVGPSPAANGGNYLNIKEWGVRFKLPEQLQSKVIYTTKNNTDVSLPNPDHSTTMGDIAYLTTVDFSALPASSCRLDLNSSQHGARVLIFRTTQNDLPYRDAAVKVENYKYIASAGNGGYCGPQSDQAAENEFVRKVVQAYKTMEVIR